MKKILITGGAGYIGSAFVHLLNCKNEYDIIVFDNLEYGYKHNIPDSVKLIVGDLRDFRSIQNAMIEVKPDAVVHFAAYALVGESCQNPLKYFNNNITGGINLLMAMELVNCNRIIFSSTCATYGIPDKLPITEETPQNPINPYGQSKLYFEGILKSISLFKELKYTIFRYFNAAGETDEVKEEHIPETHIIPNVIKSIKEEKEFNLFGKDYNTEDGTCIRDYVHVQDLAEAHYLALKNDVYGEFNLGTGKGTSNLLIIRECEKSIGKKANVKICNRRDGDPDKLVADSYKARKYMKWIPTNSEIGHILKSIILK